MFFLFDLATAGKNMHEGRAAGGGGHAHRTKRTSYRTHNLPTPILPASD